MIDDLAESVYEFWAIVEPEEMVAKMIAEWSPVVCRLAE
jgi:hypothetical protein